MAVDKIKMSQLHEEAVAEAIGGRRTRGSGSQWRDQTDAVGSTMDQEFAYASECKSTLGQSIAVSRAMLHKLREQAGGKRPALPLRFYANERLDVAEDWIAITLKEFQGLREAAENPPSIVTFTGVGAPGLVMEGEGAARLLSLNKDLSDEELHQLQQDLEELFASGATSIPRFVADEAGLRQQLQARDEVITEQRHDIELLGERPTKEQHGELMGQYARAESARRELETQLGALSAAVNAANAADPVALMARIAQLENETKMKSDLIAQLHAQQQQGALQRVNLQETMAVQPKTLPWTVIFSDHTPTGPNVRAVHYDAAGVMTQVPVHGEVRVENTARGQVQIILNGTRVKSGALISNGHVLAEVVHEPEEPLALQVGENV